MPVAAPARRGVKLRQLEPSVAIRGLHHRDLRPDALKPHHPVHLTALDRPLALQVECGIVDHAPARITVRPENSANASSTWHRGRRPRGRDDYYDHEAWNHTEESRIVLVVDMWHPGLSATEVTLLEGLHNYTYAHAKKLSRYWSANATAAHTVPTTT